MSGFRRESEITASLTRAERSVLLQLAEELLALLGQADEHDDPLAAAVGISTNDRLPEDPALARLLPDAYQNPAHAGEFRRYTEHGLREGKRQRLENVIADLEREIRLTDIEALNWAMALNDMRLFLGVRLEVVEDLDVDALSDSDPRKAGLTIFSWLGWLQQTLIECLATD